MEVEALSLRVQNVQELVATKDLNDGILERYTRPDIGEDPVCDVFDDLPIIDLGRLLNPQFSLEETTKLDFACVEWGFFQLINHGVPDELIEEVKAVIKGFFGLPMAEKETFAQKEGNLEGYGQAFVVSEEQKLDWADMFFLRTLPTDVRNMKLWPTYPPTFRETLDMYSLELNKVANILFGFIGKNLGTDPKNFAGMFDSQAMRINYYPPCPNASDKVLGFSPHSDAIALTLLLQINQVQGLQIKKNGAWFPIKPLPGAFVVNIGDILEILISVKRRKLVNVLNRIAKILGENMIASTVEILFTLRSTILAQESKRSKGNMDCCLDNPSSLGYCFWWTHRVLQALTSCLIGLLKITKNKSM